MTARRVRFIIAAPAASYVGQLADGTITGTPLASGAFSVDFGSVAGINTLMGHNGTLPAEGGYPGTGRQAFVALNGSAPSIPYSILDWTGKCHWDGANWWYCGGTTGNWPGSMTLVRYNVAENKFRHWQGATTTSNSVFGNPASGGAHNFEGACYSPTNRKIYRLMPQAQKTGVWDVDAKTGTEFPMVQLNSSTYWGIEAFPELNEFWIFGSDGSSLILRCSMTTGAELSRFNTTPTAPARTEHPALCYLNGKIYFTGADNTNFYSVNSSQSVTALATSPTRFLSYGSNQGLQHEHTVLTALNGKIYAFKLSPLATGRGVYCFDPAAGATGQWSANLTTTFPAMQAQKWTVGALNTEGVALMVGQPVNDYDGTCHIWKP
jgi:hypothetical protein